MSFVLPPMTHEAASSAEPLISNYNQSQRENLIIHAPLYMRLMLGWLNKQGRHRGVGALEPHPHGPNQP